MSFPRPKTEPPSNQVSAASVTAFNYDQTEIERDLKHALDRLQWKTLLKSDSHVFVKPNLTLPFHKPGVTTTPVLIEATLGVLKDHVREVFVGESDGGNRSFSANYSLNNHGIPGICKRTGAGMLNLSKLPRKRISHRVNGIHVEVTLPAPLLEMDQSVSLPVLKVHVVTRVSLSLKNMWGCHPDTMRLRDHTHLAERLALIADCLRLRLAVVDAITGLNVRGPMHGRPEKIGAILVGDNPVATDAVATRLIGFKAEDVDHIVAAHRFGLGPMQSSEIHMMADLGPFQRNFVVKPTFLDRLGGLTFKSALLTRLVFDSKLSEPIYKLTGSRFGRRIKNPGDEL